MLKVFSLVFFIGISLPLLCQEVIFIEDTTALKKIQKELLSGTNFETKQYLKLFTHNVKARISNIEGRFDFSFETENNILKKVIVSSSSSINKNGKLSILPQEIEPNVKAEIIKFIKTDLQSKEFAYFKKLPKHFYGSIFSNKTNVPDKRKDLNLNKKEKGVYRNLNLKNIPKEVAKNKDLIVLDLSQNKFSSIRINPKKYKKLTSLVISENPILDSKIKIRRNKNILILRLDKLGLSEIPNSVFKCKNLKELHLSGNAISETSPRKIKKLKNLEVLNLYDNALETIPDGILALKNLKTLDLYWNNIKFFPVEINELEKLETLAISHNNLWSIPENIKDCKSLTTLYVHHNKLDKLPALPENLKYLDIGYNLISEINGPLPKDLESLDVSKLALSSNLEVLLDLQKLRTLFIGKANNENEKVLEKLKSKGVIIN